MTQATDVQLTDQEMEDPRGALLAEAKEIAALVTGDQSDGGSPNDSDPSNPNRPIGRGTRDGGDGEKTVIGRDDLSRWIEDNPNAPPGALELFKHMQRTMSEQGNSNKTLEDRLATLEGSVPTAPVVEAEPTPEELERNKLLSKVSPQQRKIVELLIEQGGYVKQSDMESKEVEQALDGLFVDDVKSGLETFGEDFGTAPNGDVTSTQDFEWNPEIKDKASGLFDQMTSDDHGITPQQLYKLVRFDDLIAKAKEDGRREAGGGNAERAARFGVSTNSTPGDMRSNSIYNKGDSMDTVVDRAIVKASKKQSRMGLD